MRAVLCLYAHRLSVSIFVLSLWMYPAWTPSGQCSTLL
jgi:hypothetical protein